MDNNNFQQQFISHFLKPIAEKLKEIQKNPETTKFIQGIGNLIKNHERTSPIMERLLSEMENNLNFLQCGISLTSKSFLYFG